MSQGATSRKFTKEFKLEAVRLSSQPDSRVSEVARDLGVSEQAIYGWRRQEQVDRGLEPGLSTVEKAELAAAKRRIRELEAELAVHRRAAELLKESNDPKVGSRPSA